MVPQAGTWLEGLGAGFWHIALLIPEKRVLLTNVEYLSSSQWGSIVSVGIVIGF